MMSVKACGLSIVATVVVLTAFAPRCAADSGARLRSEIDTARSESGCPALQPDPILNDLSQRIAGETRDWVNHTARTLPTTGELDLLPTGSGGLLEAMRKAGYSTPTAKLLGGYGDYRVGGLTGDELADFETVAIKGLVLQGLGTEVLPDCNYTRYGVAVINDDGSQGWPSTAPRRFSVATAVVAGDPQAPRN